MPTWRNPTCCLEFKRHLKVWSVQAISHAWTWSLDSGRSRWRAVKAVYHIYCWKPGLLQVWLHALWAVQCTSHVPEVNAELPQGAESDILSHLPWLHNCLLADCVRTPPPLMHCLWFREHNLKLKLSKCDFFQNNITYLAHWVLKDGACPSNSNLEAIANVPCHKPMQRCMLSSVWWATTGGSSRGLHALYSPLVNIFLERGQ